MSNWVKELISTLNLDGAFIYLLDDPDGLCFEPQIASFFREKQAMLIDENDPLALRLTYEKWLQDSSQISLLIRIADCSELFIPFDIAAHAKRRSFNLTEICPEIDATVLRQIPASSFQSVVDAIALYRPGKLTPLASTDFILRHVYKIAPEIIQSAADVVRLLIRKHYVGIEMPGYFEERLVALLALNRALTQWDFTALVPNRANFYNFLQTQWERYIASIRPVAQVNNELFDSDELVVPFDDADIRVLIDNLFADGVLKPIALEQNDLPEGHWSAIGIQTPEVNIRYERCNRLLAQVKGTFSDVDTGSINAEFWLEQSHQLGVLNAISYQLNNEDVELTQRQRLNKDISTINAVADKLFEPWLTENFCALQSLPTVKVPLMLHKIPNWIAGKVSKNKKVCLLVLDGLGARQWPLLRSSLQANQSILVEEHSCFAWVPTITSISRQALFSGKRPFAFSESLLTTGKEKALWLDFWANEGLNDKQAIYAKNAEMLSPEEWENLIFPSAIQVAGIVINFVDDQMHGMKAGMAGLNKIVDVWLEQWDFVGKINALLSQGFEVVLTADHGSQEAIGIGRINDGVTAESRGERVRLYNTAVTQSSAATNVDQNVIVWPGPSSGLPQNCYPILAKATDAFKTKGEKIVGHGGISLHEVVVPLAVITSKPIQYEKTH
ncbi:BREX-3 system phosphatase PglZ [Shewanella sp. GXUN23E]|uniref:BREX-3 system phosphatase PglZ n=1 Tax=Shewanella sp. GXUN23E TaxID=3422498 RepID=UPI003D7ECFEE